jgi:hypothetical protein
VLGTPAPGTPSDGYVQSTFTTSAGGVADYLNNCGNNGSAAGFMLNSNGVSANWLTEGAQNGSTPTNGAAQVPGNSGVGSDSAPIVTADNLQNLLHSGGNG